MTTQPIANSQGPDAPIDIAALRQQLAEARKQRAAKYVQKPQPLAHLRALSLLTDQTLIQLARASGLSTAYALVAVGGYGRGLLFPCSDVDVLILTPGRTEGERQADATLERFVSLMWDIGLEPGVAVRSVRDCLEEAAKDISVDTSMLEARFVWGNAALCSELVIKLNTARDVRGFFAAKMNEQKDRHARHNDVALNLEPNIKESPGGLRDLHTVLWLSKAAGLGADWKALAAEGILTAQEARQIAQHEKVLIDLRIRLHYLAGRREDRLVFDHQTALAAQLGLHASKRRLASEALMQRYYLTAKAIWQMNSILLTNLIEHISNRQHDQIVEIDDEFLLLNGSIAARDENLFQQKPAAIFRAFIALQRHPEAEFFAPPTLRALWRAAPLINREFRDDPEVNRLFVEILKNERVTFTLRRMARYGILGRYIPAFGRIVGQMQHDLFHVYSVDEHILMVVRNLRRLVLPRFSQEFPFCHALAQDFERVEILYLAALFHDIAKGRGGDHSVLGQQDARRFCLKLGISRDDADLVAWLVGMHLTMSAVAQKQDLSDPDVIARFAESVRTERRLTALYLLTVADIRGTSPHVWNAWKSRLLEQLFKVTRRLLRGESVPNERWIENKKIEALARFRKHLRDANAVPAHWHGADLGYFQRFGPDEIAWHGVLMALREPGKASVKALARDSADGQSSTNDGFMVMVIVTDQPGLFARITHYFERLNFDIVSAKIYTDAEGLAFDTFHVFPKQGKALGNPAFAATIERDLAKALDGEQATTAAPTGRLPRQVRHFPIQPSVALSASHQSPFFELSVSCADRPGLLSTIARTLLEQGVSLHDARISTLGHRAEDVFVVEDARLADPDFGKVVCTTLEAALGASIQPPDSTAALSRRPAPPVPETAPQ